MQTIERQANIFDPIQKELDSEVFSGIQPRPRVVNFIKKLYYRELEREFGHSDPQNLVDLYITGSLTTYQWGETSDCDVSVFPNFPEFKQRTGMDEKQVRRKLVSMSIDKIDGTFLPGTTHPLQFFVVTPDNRPGDMYQPGLRSAFSIDDEMWLVEPEPDRVHDIHVELPELYKRASDMAEKMSSMLDSDQEQARALWLQVHMKRQLDQRAGLGDFSEGNIVYKYLLHEGLFDRIREELGEYIAKVGSPFDFEPNEYGILEPSWTGISTILFCDMKGFTEFCENNRPEDAARIINSTIAKALNHIEGQGGFVGLIGDAIMATFSRPGHAEAALRAAIDMQNDSEDLVWRVGINTGEVNMARQVIGDAVNIAARLESMAVPGAILISEETFNESHKAFPATYVGPLELKGRVNLVKVYHVDVPGRGFDEIIGAVGREAVEYFVDAITGSNGDVDRIRRYWTELPNLKYSIDEINEAIDKAEIIYQERKAEADRQFTELQKAHKEWLRDREENIKEVRWGFNRETGEFIIVPATTTDMVHPEMVDKWAPNLDWEDDWESIVDKFVFGYAEYDPRTGEIDPMSDASVDLPSGDLSEEEEQALVEAIRRQEGLIHIDKQTSAMLSATPFDSVSMKVIYDFTQDRIILGTQAEAANLPTSKIIGSYDGRKVVLEPTEAHWLNANYFRRLWAYSFPTRPLEEVSFREGMEEDTREITLPTRPPKRRKKRGSDMAYVAAWVMVGEPYNELLYDGRTSEHSTLLQDWLFDQDDPEMLERIILNGQLGMAFGHIGARWMDDRDDAQYYWKVYSDYLGAVEPSARLVGKAVEALKQIYPNITEWIGYSKWYKARFDASRL